MPQEGATTPQARTHLTPATLKHSQPAKERKTKKVSQELAEREIKDRPHLRITGNMHNTKEALHVRIVTAVFKS